MTAIKLKGNKKTTAATLPTPRDSKTSKKTTAATLPTPRDSKEVLEQIQSLAVTETEICLAALAGAYDALRASPTSSWGLKKELSAAMSQVARSGFSVATPKK